MREAEIFMALRTGYAVSTTVLAQQNVWLPFLQPFGMQLTQGAAPCARLVQSCSTGELALYALQNAFGMLSAFHSLVLELVIPYNTMRSGMARSKYLIATHL